jgi:circadian clock protein KaiC
VDEGQISFLVDSIITLNYVEIDSEIRRALAVLKMRGSDHAREIRRFEIQTGGITVLEQFHSRDGILSGISRRTG